MGRPVTAPYGSWKSPITSDLIISESIRLGQVEVDGADLYWEESRPGEAGRSVIVRQTPDGQAGDVNPGPYNARTRVHEYGGGAFAVAGGTVCFSNFADQQLYRVRPGGEPEQVTREPGLRYADGVIDLRRGRLVCVREDHRVQGSEPVNTLVSVDLSSGESQVLVLGADFYSTPRLSPDGSRIAWLCWNHPNMPWDGTELWVGELGQDGLVTGARQVAGGPEESVFQPGWSPDGTLHFISDRYGWWNLYRLAGAGVEPLVEMEAEFGLPQWAFGLSTYAFASAERIICACAERGVWRLATLDTLNRTLEPLELPFTQFGSIRAGAGHAIFRAGSPTQPESIVRLDLSSRAFQVLRRSVESVPDTGYLSVPQAVEFPTENGLTAHGLFYPPRNADFEAPPSERPPLLVISHGGPTGATSSTLSLAVQYWTSQGIAVLDVNYGGSTGYGRAYRERLRGMWGIVDLDDCANGARHLAERDLVDGARLMIRGRSAGGYTTLCALTFRDLFKAGASYYGVSDLEALARDTHKFESRYLDSMIGPYPQRRDLYVERSPIHFTDRLACPVIFFQGLDDKVVPPNQAELMVEALRRKGVPVAYIPFEGEGHGFRSGQNVKRSLDAELFFYSRVFGFDLAESVEPVSIENLERPSPPETWPEKAKSPH